MFKDMFEPYICNSLELIKFTPVSPKSLSKKFDMGNKISFIVLLVDVGDGSGDYDNELLLFHMPYA